MSKHDGVDADGDPDGEAVGKVVYEHVISCGFSQWRASWRPMPIAEFVPPAVGVQRRVIP